MLSKALLLVCALFVLADFAPAQRTIHVPGDVPTIQDGINAANAGDTVLVAPGTYFEHIDFLGKEITVTSSAGAATTIIDGGQAPADPTVLFTHGESRASVLNGFTIQNGGWGAAGQGGSGMPGGIYITDGQPTISNNTITHNHCYGIESSGSSPLIQGNEIDNTIDQSPTLPNEGEGCGFAAGSAIWLSGSMGYYDGGSTPGTPPALVIGNLMQNNTQSGKEDAGNNGGVGVAVWGAYAVIEANTIRNNATLGEGAVFAFNTDLVDVIGNLVYNNTAQSTSAGIDLRPPGETAGPFIGILGSNTVYANVVTSTLAYYNTPGSQVYLSGDLSQYLLVNNVIVETDPGIPALYCDPGYNYLSYTPLVFDHNDIYNGSGSAYGGACPDQTGTYGNLSADPRFANPAGGDFHLQPGSPAIDTGNNSAPMLLSTDIAGSPRIQDATGLGYPVIDMGAYEAPGASETTPTTLTLTPSTYYPYYSFFGPPVPFALTAVLAAGSQIPTGPITFYEDMNPIGTVTADSTGTARLAPAVAPGLHAFLATFPGQGAFTPAVSVKFYVLFPKPTPGILFTSSPNPSVVGAPVLFSVTVSSPDGSIPSPLTVTDTTTNTTLATLTPDANGNASFTTSSLAVGLHEITASFAGNANDDPASATLTQDVLSGILTSTTVTSSLNPSAFLQAVTFTAHVTSTGSSSTPAGTLTFLDGSTTLATVPLDPTGTASFTTSTLSPLPNAAAHTITAQFNPGAGFAASTATLLQTVNGVASITTLAASPLSGAPTDTYTLTATVANNSGTSITVPPSGTVSFTVGATPLSATLINGVATVTVTGLAPGSYVAQAHYPGDTTFAPSLSNSVTLTVSGWTTTTTLTSSPNPAYQGQTVTLSASVGASSTSPPGGSVTFYDGTTVLGTATLTAGQATFTTNALAVGTHSLSAAFPASGAFAGSNSSPLQEVVLASSFTLSLSPGAISVAAGQQGGTSILLTSVGNYSGPLTLTYSGLPQYVSASIQPSSVTLTAAASGSAKLLLNTSVASNTIPARPGSKSWPLVFSGFFLLPLTIRRTRRLGQVLTLVVAALLTQALLGCTTIRIPFNDAAVGTYQVPVTATDSTGRQQSATLTLTITP